MVYQNPGPYGDPPESAEQPEFWFLGSLMRIKLKNQGKDSRKYPRIASIHNKITHEATNFDERFQANMKVASQLSEFFPQKWLGEITAALRRVTAKKIGLTSKDDRYAMYLGYIELYLAFRGLSMLDSTLDEINKAFGVNISMCEVRKWKLKLVRLIPGLLENYKNIAKKTQRTSLVSTVIHIMNKELYLPNSSKNETFMIKQRALQIVKAFSHSQKARYIKKPEVWARAICYKAVKEITLSSKDFPFSNNLLKAKKVIENKKWQLDQVIGGEY
jgi:hypothetical protein